MIDLPARLIEDMQRYRVAPREEESLKALSTSAGWLMRGLLEEDERWPEARSEDGFLVEGHEKLSGSRVRLRGLLVSLQSGAGDCIDPMRITFDLSDTGDALSYETVLGDAAFGLATVRFNQRPKIWLEVDNVTDWILEFRGEVQAKSMAD